MKKIIIAFTAIITMMLYIASPLFIKPLNAYADYNFANLSNPLEDILDEYESENTKPNNFYTKEYLSNNLHHPITADSYVLYFKTRNDHSAGHDIATYNHSVLFRFDSGDIVFSNGVLSGENLVNGEWQYSEHYGNYSSDSFVISYNINRIEIDFQNKTFHAYDEQTGQEISHINSHMNSNPCTDIWDIQGNIPEIINSGGMNVNVVFTPNLSGHVTRPNITDNGVSRVSEIFTMDITNNSSFGIQYRFDICEYEFTGTDISYFEPNWSTGYSIRGSYGFVYVNDEWIYVQPELTGGIIKTLKSSEWHYIGARDSISQSFSWSQFNLDSNKSYIARVVAVPNRCGCATALCSARGGFGEEYPDYCIDYSEAEYVYNNLFDVVNPATFNPNDSSFGNKIHNSNYSDKYGVSAYENPSNGQLVISNADTSKDFRDILGSPTNGGSHGGGGYYNHNSSSYNNYSSSGNSFSNLNSYFTNFFGFINSALTAFPSIFLTIITLGFTGIVIIGLVKVAFK